jgi:hypothetical protein
MLIIPPKALWISFSFFPFEQAPYVLYHSFLPGKSENQHFGAVKMLPQSKNSGLEPLEESS